MIFHRVVHRRRRRPSFPPNHGRSTDRKLRTLLALSHVCGRWRQVMLGAPEFWTSIDGRHGGQLEVFLRRSYPLPISLLLVARKRDSGEYDQCHETTTKAQASRILPVHGPRIRRLDLGFTATLEEVQELLSFPSTSIECLTISEVDVPFRQPDGLSHMTLFDGHAESLKALAISSNLGWISINPFPNLTHFVFTVNEQYTRPHPDHILYLLFNMPRLEHLFLRGLLFDVPTAKEGIWTPPATPIALPCLRSLVFDDCDYEWVLSILSRTIVPRDSFVRLSQLTIEGDQPNLLLPDILHVMRHPFTSMDMYLRLSYALLVAQSEAGGFWLSIVAEDAIVDWNAWASLVPARLELAHLTTLNIYVGESDTFWPVVFAPMVRLKQLAVDVANVGYDPSTPQPIDVLCSALSQEPLLCPALHTLKIQWPTMVEPENLCVTTLTEMLATRVRLGSPIHTLAVQANAVFLINGERRYISYKSMLAPLAALVRVFSSESRPDVAVCVFKPSHVWQVEGAEKYWELGEVGRAYYAIRG